MSDQITHVTLGLDFIHVMIALSVPISLTYLPLSLYPSHACWAIMTGCRILPDEQGESRYAPTQFSNRYLKKA